MEAATAPPSPSSTECNPAWWGLEETAPWIGDLAAAGARFLAEAREESAPRWLTLAGKSGAGKSHVARRVIDRTKRRRRWVSRFVPWAPAINRIRSGDYAFRSALEGCDVLALDDIGAEYPTEFGTRTLGEILDARLGKWTVVTTNLLPREIAERLDGRIASRIFRGGSEVVTVPDAVPDFGLLSHKRAKGSHLPPDEPAPSSGALTLDRD